MCTRIQVYVFPQLTVYYSVYRMLVKQARLCLLNGETMNATICNKTLCRKLLIKKLIFPKRQGFSQIT